LNYGENKGERERGATEKMKNRTGKWKERNREYETEGNME
jgi:hypothetical protein